ncbi:MAG: sel1 repeat family protein [Opitutaceae bacterium]|nr:sel1 repeat family protein [Opitutaceae bacterium]
MPTFRITPASRLVLTLTLILSAGTPLFAQDSAPVLMSRTAGGSTWADLKEMEQAVKAGNPKAEAAFGEMLLRGEGIPKDEARGVALIEKAARAGNSAAAFRIGMLLSDGESGVTQNQPRSIEYFRAAAAGGEAEAFFNIGAAYASGKGVKRSYAEALAWLILARERGAGGDTEARLRAQIKSRPAWIATGESRAKAIVAELKDKKVADLLPPPAPLTAKR